MAIWGSEDETQQQAEVEQTPQTAATGPTQKCVERGADRRRTALRVVKGLP